MYLCQSASCGVVESRVVLFISLAQIPSRVVSIFGVRKLLPGARSQRRRATFEEDKASGKSCMVFEYEKASVMVKSLHNAGLLILFEHGSLRIFIIRTLGS